ncbi:MAG: ATP-binding cassette domain-containing protein [Deferribacteraceae bacterium]|jgi:ABC-type glutathione transport system ATPase component|nr:ATP-binding cassette domain-containing protein [Deferribacteraceae bacterium]
MSIQLLSADRITKHYNTYEGAFKKSALTFAAVDDVSLTLFKGESMGIAGQSGCGKTTLVKILAGIITPDSGSVLYKNTPVRKRSAVYPEYRLNVQMVFQNPDQSLNPRLTVESALKDLLIKRFSRKEVYNEAVRLMEITGLSEEHLLRYPSELSGGQKQRVSIAKALALRPEIIIADEPVSSLDVSVQAQILNLMSKLKKEQGVTFILISHDLAVVAWLCEKIAVMQNGAVIEYADATDIINNPKRSHTKELVDAASLGHK